MRISLKTAEKTFFAQLNDSQTAKEIVDNLPVESTVSRWGDEIYFELGFKASAAGATMDVDIGDVAYWSQGKCLCVFFGPTPASENDKPTPASPVVIVGKTAASADELRQIKMGEKITVSVD